jgi:hypothetical protein
VGTVALAERLLAAFKDRTGTAVRAFTRDGRATPELKRVIACVRLHDDATEERWMRGIASMAENPPEWVQGAMKVGHVFGENASQWTLDPERLTPNGHRSSEQVDASYARQQARLRAAGV